MKHTPGPWFADGITIESNSGNIGLMNLARPENESKANAAFIVKACNMHEELVEASKKLLKVFDRGLDEGTFGRRYCDEAKAVLAKIEVSE